MRSSIADRIVIAIAMLFLAGCASTAGGGGGIVAGGEELPTSTQKLEYYPFQVKGYQNSFPRRTVLILMPSMDRDFTGPYTANHEPLHGIPAIGVIVGQDGQVNERLYSEVLPPIIQKGLAAAAGEAGMTAEVADYSDFDPAKSKNVDYVIATIIKRCWVVKRQRADDRSSAVWSTGADFAIDAVVFKPPFKIPFWQGAVQATYNDPPIGSFGLGPNDEAGIYDEPGEVLSVALTRAIAGVFERQDFRTLVKQDQIRH